MRQGQEVFSGPFFDLHFKYGEGIFLSFLERELHFQNHGGNHGCQASLQLASEYEMGSFSWQEQINIRKKIEFFNSGFVSMCLDMLRKYAGASLKRGIYFSIAGMRLDAPEVQAENDEGERTPAFVFDFREASEHYVKASPRNSFQSGHAPGPQTCGSTVVQHPSGFNMPRNYTAMM